jgi:hypothetical protein
MDIIKIELIIRAVKEYRKIYPCGIKRDLFECFTQLGNNVFFWFNTEDDSTHLLKAEIDKSL